jgi:hypothetical protein
MTERKPYRAGDYQIYPTAESMVDGTFSAAVTITRDRGAPTPEKETFTLPQCFDTEEEALKEAGIFGMALLNREIHGLDF